MLIHLIITLKRTTQRAIRHLLENKTMKDHDSQDTYKVEFILISPTT